MLADIGLSLIYSVLISHYFGVPLTFSIIILSIIFGLLPDIDAPIELTQRRTLGGKESGFHREFTHYPIIYAPILVVIYWFFGVFWFALLTINILSHLIHDTFYPGWGLKWLWPLSKRNYMLFVDNTTGTPSTNLLASWTPDELVSTMKQHGDANWFRNIYLRISPVLIFELSVFVFGIVFLALYLWQ